MEKDRRARLGNQERLRDLVRQVGGAVSVMCSHDPREFEHDSQRSLDEPIAGSLGIVDDNPARAAASIF